MKYSEYEKIKDIKSVIYQVSILEYMGRLKIKKKFKMKKLVFVACLMVAACFASCGGKQSAPEAGADTLAVDTTMTDTMVVDTVVAE